MVACKCVNKIYMQRRINKLIRYRKLNKQEKQIRYNNMKARCGKKYQENNQRYRGVFMYKMWEENKEKYYEWLDENFYEVSGESQMDIDKDILQYGNKQYHPDLCLIVPHSINVFYETIEVGKSNITKNSFTKKYSVKVKDGKEWIRSKDVNTYNQALDILFVEHNLLMLLLSFLIFVVLSHKKYLTLDCMY